MIDLKERLNRHYRDVATAPRLERQISGVPRLAFVAIAVAMVVIAGIGVAVLADRPDEIVDVTDNDGLIEDSLVERSEGVGELDPNVERLLSRIPLELLEVDGNDGALVIRYLDLERFIDSAGDAGDPEAGRFLIAIEKGPIPRLVSAAIADPDRLQQAFGIRPNELGQVVEIDGRFGYAVFTPTIDASVVVDNAAQDAAWIDDLERRLEGAFDVLDWGDDADIIRRDEIRPLGRGGQLASDGTVVIRTTDSEAMSIVTNSPENGESLLDIAQLRRALGFATDDMFGIDIIVDTQLEHSENDINVGVDVFPSLVVLVSNLEADSFGLIGYPDDVDLEAIVPTVLANLEFVAPDLSFKVTVAEGFIRVEGGQALESSIFFGIYESGKVDLP